ncbi:hypothetical protein N0V84_002141 [Fusarium piperis]|uniref:F-box domain-containing protein n=1 Tax=Fusarium piperis TaxID=1435070 RepID=A0A9W8WJP2_9HYPO|nr:hypothetical protein N0V84_002141 [Fusarium piperis]
MVIFLPDEIWRQIFSHFEVVLQDDYRDLEPLKTLTALRLVSRRLSYLAQTLLYRTVLLWGLNDFYIGDRHDLHVLLATVLASHPQLGRLTRGISLAHGNLTVEDDPMTLLRKRITSLSMSSRFKDRLRREFIFGRNGAGVASFLLALMPKGQTCISINYFESVLLHPNLRTLKLSGFDWTENRVMDMEWQGYPCDLRQLNLDRCIVDASTMRDVLSRCKNLEVFTITMGSHDLTGHRPYQEWEVDLYEFGDALRELGQQLVKFELDTSDYKCNGEATGKIRSLCNLKSLRHLSIARNDFIAKEDDPGAIQLSEALPMSIEVMDFKEDVTDLHLGQEEYEYGRMYDALYGLLVGGQFTSLRELTMIRLGTPEKDRFKREVPGWDVEERGWYVDVSPDYDCYTSMELFMKRRGHGSGRVEDE